MKKKNFINLIYVFDNMWYIRDLKFKFEFILVVVENWMDVCGF